MQEYMGLPPCTLSTMKLVLNSAGRLEVGASTTVRGSVSPLTGTLLPSDVVS
jgi:hypothetical protein